MNKSVSIEVFYIDKDIQQVIPLFVTIGTTVEQAIHQSGILEQFPSLDLAKNKIGIFSKLVSLDKVLEEGDRVEIYRPLLIDPKQARKQRAKRRR